MSYGGVSEAITGKRSPSGRCEPGCGWLSAEVHHPGGCGLGIPGPTGSFSPRVARTADDVRFAIIIDSAREFNESRPIRLQRCDWVPRVPKTGPVRSEWLGARVGGNPWYPKTLPNRPFGRLPTSGGRGHRGPASRRDGPVYKLTSMGPSGRAARASGGSTHRRPARARSGGRPHGRRPRCPR